MTYRISDRPLRVLALSPTFPYPPHDGSNLRIWHMYRLLAKKTNLTLTCTTHVLPSEEHIEKCFEEKINLKLLQLPQWKPLSALRIKLAFLLRNYPVWTAGYYSPKVHHFLDQLLRHHDFDLVMIESAWLPFCLKTLGPYPAPKILDLHDTDSEKWRRQADLLPLGRKKLYYLQNASGFRRTEDYLLGRVEMAFVPSEREKVLLAERYRSARIEVVPNGVDTESLKPLPASEAKELLFVGSLSYLPNVEGIVFFTREVLPELKIRFPELRCLIVGRTPAPVLKSLDGINGVELVGEVPDLEPYYRRAAVCVVPIRAGSGTRLKILEAMAYGRPVVSTCLGCEGLDVENRKHVLIADRPREMTDAIIELLENPRLALEIAKHGRELVSSRYCWTSIVEEVHKNLLNLTGCGYRNEH